MVQSTDPRVDLARSRSMREVLDKLPPIEGLQEAFGELTGPCPRCGGRDRFSINMKEGVYNCRSCGGGDPLQLAMMVLDCGFMQAVEHLEGSREQEIDPAELERRRARREAEERRRREDAERYRQWSIEQAREIWKSARHWRGTAAEEYLRRRGLDITALARPFACFRFLPAHPYVKKIGRSNRRLHVGPALISAIQDPAGRLAAVHQTFIDLDRPKGKAEIRHPDTGEALPAKLVKGSKKGGAIRLTGTACLGALVMGEGIETTLTALAAGAVPGASYWAGVDLGNMGGKQTGRNSGRPDLSDERAFLPPRDVGRLVFIQDADSDPAMTRAKLLAGIRRAKHANPALRGAIVAAAPGGDLNDMIHDRKKKGTANE